MARFIVVTFAFLGWAFYEMSGGAEFEPASVRLTDIRTDPLKQAVVAQQDQTLRAVEDFEENVTRVSLNLTSVEDVLTGGTTQPSRNVSALPQIDTTETDADAFPAPDSSRVAAIIPSLVEGADTAELIQISASAEDPAFQSDIRSVTGSRVNVRGGPGTQYSVVNRLVRGDQVEVLEDDGSGWVRMRPLEGGLVGWMSAPLLTDR